MEFNTQDYLKALNAGIKKNGSLPDPSRKLLEDAFRELNEESYINKLYDGAGQTGSTAGLSQHSTGMDGKARKQQGSRDHPAGRAE